VNELHRLERTQLYNDAIRRILLRHWAQIGITSGAQKPHEYDCYITEIHRRLIHHVTEKDLFDHLWEIEAEHMGLYGDPSKTNELVQRLLSLASMFELDMSA
jgi:hypothetical protein